VDALYPALGIRVSGGGNPGESIPGCRRNLQDEQILCQMKEIACAFQPDRGTSA
jgi:hypothetical protein